MRFRSVLWALALIALLSIPFLLPNSKMLVSIGLSIGLTSLGILFLLRAGQISFGHGLYYAAGAYTVAFLVQSGHRLDIAVLLPLAVMVAGLMAAVIGLFAVRYRDIFFAMLNLAMSMVAYSLLEKMYSITGGGDGLNVPRPTFFGFKLGRVDYEFWIFYLAMALAIIATLCAARYLRSPMGVALDAIKSNETRLEYLGVSSRRLFHSAYVFSAMLAGLSGGMMAIITGHVTPEFAYWTRSGEFVFIAVLGGVGNVVGAFAGAITFEIVRNYAAIFAADYWQMILGIVLIVIILFAPGGLVGMFTPKSAAGTK